MIFLTSFLYTFSSHKSHPGYEINFIFGLFGAVTVVLYIGNFLVFVVICIFINMQLNVLIELTKAVGKFVKIEDQKNHILRIYTMHIEILGNVYNFNKIYRLYFLFVLFGYSALITLSVIAILAVSFNFYW